MNQQLIDKIQTEFEPIKEACDRGEFLGALLCATFGTGNDSMVWYVGAGNQSAINACAEYAREAIPSNSSSIQFTPYAVMVVANQLFAAILLIMFPNGKILKECAGPDPIINWLIHEHKMRTECLIKTTLSLTMQSQMQAAAQAQLMAQQLSQGKIIRGNGGRG